jgi:aldose 1-epimerase
MSIEREPFGKTKDAQLVERFTLRSARLLAKIITYGGKITEFHSPDRSGNVGNVVLGHDNLECYLTDRAYLGTLVGRVCNRIARGTFTLDGAEYKLPLNDGPNTLHGGTIGFDKVIWEPTIRDTSADTPALELRYTSPAGQDGFPGTVRATVLYTLTSDALRIDYTATTDKATPINLTNHSYFNLKGPGSGDVLDHVVTINASRYTPVDETLIPTGEIAPVAGTVFDFTTPTPIGTRIKQVPGGPPIGYDHNYALDTQGDVSKLATRIVEPTSGRVLETFTTQPGLQFYSGNFLDGSIHGIGGAYQQYGAFCLETQHYPDAVHHLNFPSTILRPAETYRQTTIYRFGAAQ